MTRPTYMRSLPGASSRPARNGATLAQALAPRNGREPRQRGERVDVLGIAADGVQEQVTRAEGDQLVESRAHLLRRAVDAGRVDPFGISIHRREPAVNVGSGHARSLVNREEHPL